MPDKKMSHEEVIDEAMRMLHDSLLTGGAKEMRTTLKVSVLFIYRQWLKDNGWKPPS
jgi:hypothetical protein